MAKLAPAHMLQAAINAELNPSAFEIKSNSSRWIGIRLSSFLHI
jgi:hypothetical protein